MTAKQGLVKQGRKPAKATARRHKAYRLQFGSTRHPQYMKEYASAKEALAAAVAVVRQIQTLAERYDSDLVPLCVDTIDDISAVVDWTSTPQIVHRQIGQAVAHFEFWIES